MPDQPKPGSPVNGEGKRGVDMSVAYEIANGFRQDLIRRQSECENLKKQIHHLKSEIMLRDINEMIQKLTSEQRQQVTDGYHTFSELYEFRKMFNAVLFNQWAELLKYNVHKSIRHEDGEICFGGGWFVVIAMLPDGQITNHYEMKDWDLFKIPQKEKALFKFDGHNAQDVLNRLSTL